MAGVWSGTRLHHVDRDRLLDAGAGRRRNRMARICFAASVSEPRTLWRQHSLGNNLGQLAPAIFLPFRRRQNRTIVSRVPAGRDRALSRNGLALLENKRKLAANDGDARSRKQHEGYRPIRPIGSYQCSVFKVIARSVAQYRNHVDLRPILPRPNARGEAAEWQASID